MTEFLLISLCICLGMVIGNKTEDLSGDTMKAVGVISICILIGFVWYFK